jgi:hypothetical protein
MIQDRSWGSWPNRAELLAMPLGNLGLADYRWFVEADGQPLPDPVLQAGSDGDDTWLHVRVRHTPHHLCDHDLWDVASG